MASALNIAETEESIGHFASKSISTMHVEENLFVYFFHDAEFTQLLTPKI